MNTPKRNKVGRPSTGGPTSAASVSMTFGFRDDQKAYVEDGKRIYWYDLLRSVNEAYDNLCMRRPDRYNKHYV